MKGFCRKTIHFAVVSAFWMLFWTLLAVPGFSDETWGAGLFKVKRHDFGRVALGADAEYRFVFENNFVQNIRIVDAQSSCGCTNVSFPKSLIKSEEKGMIVAKLNTTGQHLREKSATITVHLEANVEGRILRDVVQLFVTGYIRPDVVLTPGIIEFGSVPEGKTVVRELRLDYSGRPDWALTKIERGNRHVHAKAEEIKRNYGDISYKITVTLRPNTPVGYVKDALRFTTNERSVGISKASEIVLPIQGNVMAPIHAKPSPFMVGLIAPGESVAKSLVVRSETPFRILSIETPDKRFRFSFAKQESNIQIVSVLFSSTKDSQTGPVDLNNKIRIRTNLPDQEFIVLDALTRIAPKNVETKPSGESQKEDKSAAVKTTFTIEENRETKTTNSSVFPPETTEEQGATTDDWASASTSPLTEETSPSFAAMLASTVGIDASQAPAADSKTTNPVDLSGTDEEKPEQKAKFGQPRSLR